jgi:hypothetical protein
MRPNLKAPGTNRLKLRYDESLSNFALNFSLRRYNTGGQVYFYPGFTAAKVGRCRLTLSNPR